MVKSNVGERFSEFFEKWVCQLEECLQQLLRVSRGCANNVCEQELQSLISKVTQHYKDYYAQKWALAHEDVLAFFCPIWVSPLENAYSWITGWKPSMVFKLVDSMKGSSLSELTQEQQRKIDQLRLKVRLEEEKVEREMERQQVAMADRKMVELARLESRVGDGGPAGQVVGLVEAALKGIMAGLEKVMKAADCVRLRTLKGVLDALSPLQCVDFLAGTCMLQIQLRQWGKRKIYITSNSE